MVTRPRHKTVQGSWSDSRIDSSKPFNLKYYPNATTIDRWTETSYRNRGLTIDMDKNSFSVERMCYLQGMGSRDYKGCYYPLPRNYDTPTFVISLRNSKGNVVWLGNQQFNTIKLSDTFHAFNPQTVLDFWNEDLQKSNIFIIDESKLDNDGKIYGKAFIALFPNIPEAPQVDPSIYNKYSAETVSQLYYTEHIEADYLSKRQGKLASNTVNFVWQYRMPTPIITVKKKQVRN